VWELSSTFVSPYVVSSIVLGTDVAKLMG